jgi:heterodisulfide reductase subunit C
MDVQPRQIVAYFRAGDLESILRSRTIWICASCYACTVRCPAGIKVTELMYGLKRMALESKMWKGRTPIHALSEHFVKIVNRYGRNQELELTLRYFLRKAPIRLLRMVPLGWRLLRAGRFPWRTERIEGIQGLRKIIAKADEMDQAYPKEILESIEQVGYGAVTERIAAQPEPQAASGGEA